MRYREARTPQHMQTSRGIKAATGVLFVALAALGASLSATQVSSNDDLAALRQAFDAPPDDARIMMRWWWFGPQVTDEELGRELQAMKDAGIGGVEVQAVYPVALDGAANGLKTEPFLSDAFLAHLKFAADRARGSRPALRSHARQRLAVRRPDRVDRARRRPPSNRARADSAASVARRAAACWRRRSVHRRRDRRARRVDAARSGGGASRADGTVARRRRRHACPRELVVFISSRTGQMVKRAAVGAEGFVLDHYDADATSGYLSSIGERLWSAFGRAKPFAIFCDSLEVYDSDWTPDFPSEFQKRRGYDIRPRLLELASGDGRRRPPTSATTGARRSPSSWTSNSSRRSNSGPPRAARSCAGRIYGTPPASTSSAMLVDLPEGEGADWRGLSATRWAASASHVKGVAVTSAETWTWLHSPAFASHAARHEGGGGPAVSSGRQPAGRATAGRTRRRRQGHPGWRFYAAAALSEGTRGGSAMPDVARALQRTSAMLRQGTPVVDVALYLPVDDAWADFSPGNVDLIEVLRKRIGPDVIPSILDAGFSFDLGRSEVARNARQRLQSRRGRLSHGGRGSLSGGGASQRRADPRGRTADYGGIRESRRGHRSNRQPGQALAAHLTPDVTFRDPAIAAVHRRVGNVDFYFIANTSSVLKNTDSQLVRCLPRRRVVGSRERSARRPCR